MLNRLNLAQYLQMWTWINEWQNMNNTEALPSYVDISRFNLSIKRLDKAVYLDMWRRVLKFKELHDGKMPEVIGVEGPATGTEPQSILGSIKSRLETSLGVFNSFTGFWGKIQGRGYKHYYNSSYTLEETISRILRNEGVNCVDSMQLCYSLAREMKYEAEYVHVKCKEGGHIRGQIRGHEFMNWTRIDPAAALSIHTQAPIGEVWCDYPNARIDRGEWLKKGRSIE